ncbi:MAG: c-type cytochrome [Actinomycetota bacterium]
MHLTLGLTLWENNVRYWVGYLNAAILLGIVGFLVWTTLSRHEMELEKPAPNRTEFLSDSELEGRRLERVLGWSLVFVSAFAVAFLVYMLREPVRQDHSESYFSKGATERGETLFASTVDEAYDSVLSLQCASCHSSDGSGGAKATPVDRDGPDGPEKPRNVIWKVPPLNTVLLRFTEDPECADPRDKPGHICELTDIITYGRPGTPMPAFGLDGGGAENEQTINDVIAYLRTIQIKPEQATKQAAARIEAERKAPDEQVTAAEEVLATADSAFDEARAAVLELTGDATATEDDALVAECEQIEQRAGEGDELDAAARETALACRTLVDAFEAVVDAQAALDWANEWRTLRADVSEGQLLFETNCARCHTQGWSIFDPAVPGLTEVLGEPGGGGGAGGGIGPNLRDGATVRRFGSGEIGVELHTRFVSDGSNPFEQYGRNGVGSGKMPGFAKMLTKEQIAAIVEYEREGLDDTTYDVTSDDAEELEN